MTKKILFVLTILMMSATTDLMAQYDDYEISFVDEKGRKQEIDVPYGLEFEFVDSMIRQYHIETYLHKEESCNMKDYDPETDRETYIARLRRMPTAIDMPYNDVVRRFIDRYTKRGRRQVSLMLGTMNFYAPIFEEALEAYNLPLELKYLPVIESGLNANAVSPAGAAGLWQFMVSTGKQYNLKINSLVDERRDPLKSSWAAAKLLSDMYKVFGDWHLVLAAYNCGPGNVNRAIHRAGGSKDYWEIYPYLPKETRGYVPAFIAACYVMTYYCDHNICPMATTLPVASDTVSVNRDVRLDHIARVCGLDSRQVRELNPQYRRDIANGSSGAAIVRLPASAIPTFIDNQDRIYSRPGSNRRSEVNVNEGGSRNNWQRNNTPANSQKEDTDTQSDQQNQNNQSDGSAYETVTYDEYGNPHRETIRQ